MQVFDEELFWKGSLRGVSTTTDTLTRLAVFVGVVARNIHEGFRDGKSVLGSIRVGFRGGGG